MRLFISIPMPPVAQAIVRNLAAQHAAEFSDYRWIDPGHLHVTLKFLGEVDQITGDAARKALGSVSMGEPISLKFGRLRELGPTRDVLALELAGEVEPLVDLQSRIEEAFVRLGFERETRAFLPHVSIARRKSDGRSQPRRVSAKAPDRWFNTTAVCLTQSTQTPNGSEYTPLLKIPMTDLSL